MQKKNLNFSASLLLLKFNFASKHKFDLKNNLIIIIIMPANKDYGYVNLVKDPNKNLKKKNNLCLKSDIRIYYQRKQ